MEEDWERISNTELFKNNIRNSENMQTSIAETCGVEAIIFGKSLRKWEKYEDYEKM